MGEGKIKRYLREFKFSNVKLTKDKKILSNAIEVSTVWAKRSKIEFGNNKKKSQK